jgi:predicted rRNA methylase YqxC with S4 and FtsJ domains
MFIKTRDELTKFKYFFQNKIVCEIGVFRGDFSQLLLESKPKELHLIDPFVGKVWCGDKDGNNVILGDMQENYEYVKERFKSNKEVIIHKDYSFNVLPKFNDNYFDLIYIDGEHNYSSVISDLNLSRLKVKNNGVVSGHDYSKEKFPDVVNAVDKFCCFNRLNISILTKDVCPSFFIINSKD